MSEKKMVRRSVAISLWIVCIILLAGLGVAMAYYTIQINNRDAKYNDYVTTHSHSDSDYNQLRSEDETHENQVNDLASIVNFGIQSDLVYRQTIEQEAGSNTSWDFPANYPGYISVFFLTSNTSNIHVRVTFSSMTWNFSQEIVVSGEDMANFAVLPSIVHLEIINSDMVNGATETVTILYRY